MSLSPSVIERIKVGERRSQLIGQPAIAFWRSRLEAQQGQLLVLFDHRSAEHPQQVASVMHCHDEKSGELERRALTAFRSRTPSQLLAQTRVHDFRGRLTGHRLVVVTDAASGYYAARHIIDICSSAVRGHAAELLAI